MLVVLASGGPLFAQEQTNAGEPRPTMTARADDAASERFHLLLGMYLTAASTDVSVSMYQIGRGTAREIGFGGWMQDSPVAFSLTKSAMGALVAYQLEHMHRRRPKLAMTLMVISTGLEVALAARAATINGPPR